MLVRSDTKDPFWLNVSINFLKVALHPSFFTLTLYRKFGQLKKNSEYFCELLTGLSGFFISFCWTFLNQNFNMLLNYSAQHKDLSVSLIFFFQKTHHNHLCACLWNSGIMWWKELTFLCSWICSISIWGTCYFLTWKDICHFLPSVLEEKKEQVFQGFKMLLTENLARKYTKSVGLT